MLPEKPKKPITDLSKYLFLIYGREKIGKTTFFASWDDALFLTTEPGTKGLEIYEVECNDWRTIRKVVSELEKTNRFKTVIIDTIDRAYDFCLDYVCDQLGITYPGEDDEGHPDYGKSWRAVKLEFTELINRLVFTGRGVCFTSHLKEMEIRLRTGERWHRIVPSMSKQGRSVVEAIVDFFFYAEYMRLKSGEIIRVLITEGDEFIWAGQRKIQGFKHLPQFLPLVEEGGKQMLLEAFKGKFVGINPGDLLPAKMTPKATQDFLNRRRVKEINRQRAKKKIKK